MQTQRLLQNLKTFKRQRQLAKTKRRELEIVKTTEHYQNLIDLAKKNSLDTTNLESALAEKIKEIRSKGAEETSKNETYWENLTQQQKAQIASQGFQNLATNIGKNRSRKSRSYQQLLSLRLNQLKTLINL